MVCAQSPVPPVPLSSRYVALEREADEDDDSGEMDPRISSPQDILFFESSFRHDHINPRQTRCSHNSLSPDPEEMKVQAEKSVYRLRAEELG